VLNIAGISMLTADPLEKRYCDL